MSAARDESRAVQRRLLEVAPRARLWLGLAVAAGLGAAAVLVVQAWLIADGVTDAIDGRAPGGSLVAVLAGAAVLRAALGAGLDAAGRRAAGLALGALRDRVAERALAGRAPRLGGARRGDVAAAATQGIDALAEYYARALPQAALAAVVPVGIVVVLGARVPLVGVLLATTIPLLIVFMVLVGRRSADHARERQEALAVLGAHLLEVVRGLPTLRAHGRAGAQAATVAAVAERYRRESLGALRVAFLSALVLELLAMLGTAVAAAVTGVLLAQGHLDLAAGLFVLLLAPEVYAPLRTAGARFHAAEDGMQAARRVLALLDEPAPFADLGRGGADAPDPASEPVRLRAIRVAGSDGRPDPLSGLDLDLVPGGTLALVGPSGAGKSTVLRLLARVQDPDAGTLACGGADLADIDREAWWSRVSWLDQRPPLAAGTLGEALRLHAPRATAEELRLALERADALEVLAALPDGEATRVGAGGRPLSLGQQQRVALAAALASNAPLLLLDEPTAHLDAEAARRAAAGIVAAAAGRTLVVATHDAELAAACDATITLRQRGQARPMLTAPVTHERGEAPSGPAPPTGEPERGQAPFMPAAAPEGGLGRAAALGVLAAVASLALLGTSGWLITRAAERPPVLALLAAIVVVRALGLMRAGARYAERLASHDVALRRLAAVRVRFYERLAPRVGGPGLPGSADLLTRLTQDVDALQDGPVRVLLPAIVAAAASLAAIAGAVALLPAAGVALTTGLLLAVLVVPALVGRLADAASRAQGPARAAYAAELAEVLELGPQLAVAGRGPDRLTRLRARAAALGRIDLRHARAAWLGTGLSGLVAGLTQLAVLVLGARAAAAGELDAVWLGALVVLAMGAFDAPGALPEGALARTAVRAARRRLEEATAGPELAPPPTRPRPLPAGPTALTAQALVHRPGGPGTPAVLGGVAVAIAPGEHVAIVGPSGAGKSTLAALLARLADPDAGTVALGGVDLRDAAEADLRDRIRLAGQDAHLLAGTLAANVRIGRTDASDAEVAGALEAAGLGAWLAALPEGLQTPLGEDGALVSGGQRQRISLARALLSPAGVLILDEPTAMLDPATAAEVLEDVLAAAGDRTLVVITHDPAHLDRFDRVLELRDGRLAERRAAAVA